MAQELHFVIRTYENWTESAIQEIADEFVRLYDGNLAIESAFLREVKEIAPPEWTCSHCGDQIRHVEQYGPEHHRQCELYAEQAHHDEDCDEPDHSEGPCPGYEPPEAFADGYSVGRYGTEELFVPDEDWQLDQYQRGRAAGVDALREALYGHCDTCGAPCDENGCTTDRTHIAALEG